MSGFWRDQEESSIARARRRTAQVKPRPARVHRRVAHAKSKIVRFPQRYPYYFLGNVIINVVPLEGSLCTAMEPL